MLALRLSRELNVGSLNHLLLLARLAHLAGHRRQRDRAIVHGRTREGDPIVVHRHDRGGLRVVGRIH